MIAKVVLLLIDSLIREKIVGLLREKMAGTRRVGSYKDGEIAGLKTALRLVAEVSDHISSGEKEHHGSRKV